MIPFADVPEQAKSMCKISDFSHNNIHKISDFSHNNIHKIGCFCTITFIKLSSFAQ